MIPSYLNFMNVERTLDYQYRFRVCIVRRHLARYKCRSRLEVASHINFNVTVCSVSYKSHMDCNLCYWDLLCIFQSDNQSASMSILVCSLTDYELQYIFNALCIYVLQIGENANSSCRVTLNHSFGKPLTRVTNRTDSYLIEYCDWFICQLLIKPFHYTQYLPE